MLKEIMSPVFIKDGKQRGPIIFHKGLNVVLGTPMGANSIGKSSAMQAIDFVFGGNTYLNGDGIEHVGHHTIFFTYEFKGRSYRFARNTKNPDDIIICDDQYKAKNCVMKKSEFMAWLSNMYDIDYPGLSFRQAISGFFRIHQKGNTSYDQDPPCGIHGDNKEKALNRLIKLYNKYGEIESYTLNLNEQNKKLTAYKQARKYNFVSSFVNGVKQYETNNAKIHALQIELDNLTSSQMEIHSEQDIEKSRIKDELIGKKIDVEDMIASRKRKMKLLNMNLEYGLYPSEADIASLQEYFPSVNIRRLYEVENYHKKLAQILDNQFADEKRQVFAEIQELENQRKEINNEIDAMGIVASISKEFLDKHSELVGQIKTLSDQNNAYLTLQDLTESKKLAMDHLKKATEQILSSIEQTLNTHMAEYNHAIIDGTLTPPEIRINSYKSFTFKTDRDTGSAAGYKAMILYDLAILNTTGVPAIAHDSLMFGDMGIAMTEGIMKLYEKKSGSKQIFIAFDKQETESEETQRIVIENAVLQLGIEDEKLYGRSWNTL